MSVQQSSHLTSLINHLEELVANEAVGISDPNNRYLLQAVDIQNNGVFYYDENGQRKLNSAAATAFKALEFPSVNAKGKKKLADLAQSAVTQIGEAIKKLEEDSPATLEVRLTSQKDVAETRSKLTAFEAKFKELNKLKNHLSIAKAALENKSLSSGESSQSAKPLTTCEKATQAALYVFAALGVAASAYALKTLAL